MEHLEIIKDIIKDKFGFGCGLAKHGNGSLVLKVLVYNKIDQMLVEEWAIDNDYQSYLVVEVIDTAKAY